jgi:DNA-binding NtrC family response regulator
MESDRILVVDDEKNIRITLAQALEDLGPVDTAMNGEEALCLIEENEYRLVLLDLKMPGMDGLTVLKRMAERRPEIRFVIITAHGTVDNAVEAMKLGAVDYIQKPFSPAEIRELARRVLNRQALDQERRETFDHVLELAKRAIGERRFDAAMELLRRAAALKPERPEVLNLMGAVHEIRGSREEAVKSYRAAYWLAPSYAPARENLERLTGTGAVGRNINLGPEPESKK